MEASQIPPMFFAAFGGAFVAILVFLGCLFLLTKRMGMTWKSVGAAKGLGAADNARLGRVMWGRETPPEGGASLVVVARAAFVTGALLIVGAVVILARAV